MSAKCHKRTFLQGLRNRRVLEVLRTHVDVLEGRHVEVGVRAAPRVHVLAIVVIQPAGAEVCRKARLKDRDTFPSKND